MNDTKQLVTTLDRPITLADRPARRETFSYLAGSHAHLAPGVRSGARVTVGLDGRSYPGQVLHIAETVDGPWVEARLDHEDIYGQTLVHVSPAVVAIATGAVR